MPTIFLSHEWGYKDRVRAVSRELKGRGFDVWIDIEKMCGNISVCMADGIRRSDIVILFLSKAYIDKVNTGLIWDNCYKEFAYSLFLHKKIIPVVLDPALLNVEKWPMGIVAMCLHNILYVDGSMDNINTITNNICQRIYQECMSPLPRVRDKKLQTMLVF